MRCIAHDNLLVCVHMSVCHVCVCGERGGRACVRACAIVCVCVCVCVKFIDIYILPGFNVAS